MMQALLSKPLLYFSLDVLQYVSDDSKTKSELVWYPRVPSASITYIRCISFNLRQQKPPFRLPIGCFQPVGFMIRIHSYTLTHKYDVMTSWHARCSVISVHTHCRAMAPAVKHTRTYTYIYKCVSIVYLGAALRIKSELVYCFTCDINIVWLRFLFPTAWYATTCPRSMDLKWYYSVELLALHVCTRSRYILNKWKIPYKYFLSNTRPEHENLILSTHWVV